MEEIFSNSNKMDELLKKIAKIEDLLDDKQYANVLESNLRDKLHQTKKQLIECRAVQEEYENRIKEFYEDSLKVKSEGEILDILAS